MTLVTRTRRVLFSLLVVLTLAALGETPSRGNPLDGNSPVVLGSAAVADAEMSALLQARRQQALKEVAAIRQGPPAPLMPGRKWVPLCAGGGLGLPSVTHAITLDLSKQLVTAAGKLTVKNSGLTNVSEVYLYLERFPKASLSVKGPSGPLAFVDVGYDLLRVALGDPLLPGQTREITTSQTGVPSCKPGTLGVMPCIVSASLACVVGAYWTPLLLDESQTDFVDPDLAVLQVTVPAGMKVAAAGLDAGVLGNPNGTSTWSFQLSRPPTFAAGPFVTGSDPLGGKQVRSFVLASNAGNAAGWRQAGVDILAFHEQRYGPYDLPKLDIVESFSTAGAAFGPLSAVFIPPQVLAEPPLDWRSRVTLAHELGHQWFGGFIALGDPYSPWINEGFATFAEMEYTIAGGSKAFGLDYGPTYRKFEGLTYLYTVRGGKDVPLTGTEIGAAPDEVYVAVTYNKGGLVVSMLRYLVGDAAFLQAMKRYRLDHAGSEATLPSLGASVKAATGKDVSAFLQSWATEAGYPTFDVEVLRSSEGSSFVTGVKATASKAPQLPLELELVLADGSTRKEQLAFGGSTSQSATFTTSSEVLQVRFDPASQVVGRSRGALPGDIVLDGDVDGVDLIELGWAMGRGFDPWDGRGLFPGWADLIFDGKIDQQDADQLLGSFGKKAGEGG